MVGVQESPLREEPPAAPEAAPVDKSTSALTASPFQLAVTEAVWLVAIAPAVAKKFALVAPELTVTFAGTVSSTRLLDNATVAAPSAAALSVTVQVALWPASSIAGAQASPESFAGCPGCSGSSGCSGSGPVSVSEKVCVTPLAFAEMTTV
jgi:hypothetical protein